METEILPVATELARAFLATPFEEYTVTEGFLLLFFLAIFIWFIVQLFKGGF